jgi:hypothetical protein
MYLCVYVSMYLCMYLCAYVYVSMCLCVNTGCIHDRAEDDDGKGDTREVPRPGMEVERALWIFALLVCLDKPLLPGKRQRLNHPPLIYMFIPVTC